MFVPAERRAPARPNQVFVVLLVLMFASSLLRRVQQYREPPRYTDLEVLFDAPRATLVARLFQAARRRADAAPFGLNARRDARRREQLALLRQATSDLRVQQPARAQSVGVATAAAATAATAAAAAAAAAAAPPPPPPPPPPAAPPPPPPPPPSSNR